MTEKRVGVLSRLRKALSPPVFEGDEEKTRIAALLNAILIIVVFLVSIYMVVTLLHDLNVIGVSVEVGLIAASLGLLFLLHRGHMRITGIVISTVLWGLISVGTYAYGGLYGSGVSSFFGVALIAALLLGWRMGLVFTGLSIISLALMMVAEVRGVIPPVPDFVTPVYRWIELSTTLGGLMALLYLAMHSLERALEQARTNAQVAMEASEFKSRLIGRISHELRTPLAAVLGLTEMLHYSDCGTLNPKQQEIAQKIVRNTNHLSELVAQLLEQSRFESGRLRLEVEPFSPVEVVAATETRLGQQAEAKGLVLTTHVADGAPDVVQGDPRRVAQILDHLVGNAIKFTKQGAIDVYLLPHSRTNWALRIVDTGLGIPEDAHEYIFEPFRQVDDTVTREYGGLGLGLSIAKRLAMLMGGEITLASRLGEGSTFTVVLPRILEE